MTKTIKMFDYIYMNYIQKMTKHIPKYLLVLFVVIMVFNIVTYFFSPGIKEAHKGSDRKLGRYVVKTDKTIKRLKRAVKGNTKHRGNMRHKMDINRQQTWKKGSDIKPDDYVSVPYRR